MGDPNPQATDEPGRVAALDFGMARIGVAVADELGLLAHPRPFVAAKPPARALAEILRLVRHEQVTRLLVGLPRNMDGTEGMAARRVRKFVVSLEEKVRIPIELVDERLSTVEAQSRLHAAGRTEKSSRTLIDSASAAILLQSWLDGRGRRERE